MLSTCGRLTEEAVQVLGRPARDRFNDLTCDLPIPFSVCFNTNDVRTDTRKVREKLLPRAPLDNYRNDVGGVPTPPFMLISDTLTAILLFLSQRIVDSDPTISISGDTQWRPLHAVVGYLPLGVSKAVLTCDAAATESTYSAPLLPTCPRE